MMLMDKLVLVAALTIPLGCGGSSEATNDASPAADSATDSAAVEVAVDGSAVTDSGPAEASVADVGAPLVPATQLSAGQQHLCLLLASGSARCLGRESTGEVSGASVTPKTPYLQLAAGAFTTCARTAEGARCWGNRLGLGGAPAPDTCIVAGTGPEPCSRTPQDLPSTTTLLDLPAVGLALTADRRLLRWGVTAPALHPTSDRIDAAAPGSGFTCYRVGGSVKCFGANDWGQLGRGTFGAAVTDEPVAIGSITDATGVWSGHGSTACAARADGSLLCWGRYGLEGASTTQICTGALVAPTPYCSPTPVAVPLGGKRVLKVTVGSEHTCALLEGGTASCWGRNYVGQIGNGVIGTTADPALAPTPVDLTGIEDLAAGGNFTCALVKGGGLRCWGQDFASATRWAKPTPVAY